MTETDRDVLVAAILTAPTIVNGYTGTERVEAFKATLQALAKSGGVRGVVEEVTNRPSWWQTAR